MSTKAELLAAKDDDAAVLTTWANRLIDVNIPMPTHNIWKKISFLA
jgi:hypothetical protein